MLNRIKGIILKDPIVSLNVIPFLILFTIPFPPATFFWPGPFILAIEPFLPQSDSLPQWANILLFPIFLLPFWLFGVTIALFVGKYFSKLNRPKHKPWFTYLWTPLIWFGILILIEAAVFLFVRFGLGLRIGA
jgi:hypothetical protein